MEQVGVRDLRRHVSGVLRRVKAGETIEVTQRGQPVARLIPPPPLSRLDQLIAEGRATPAAERWQDNIDQLPRIPSPPGSPSAADLVSEMREERLP